MSTGALRGIHRHNDIGYTPSTRLCNHEFFELKVVPESEPAKSVIL
jgi:hypothetical protein